MPTNDPLGPVFPGDRPPNSARAFDAYRQAARANRATQLGRAPSPGPLDSPVDPANTVLVRAINAALAPFTVTRYGDATIAPTETTAAEARRRPVFDFAPPSSDEDDIAVVVEGVGAGGGAVAVSAGVTAVRVDITNTTHTRAVPVADDAEKLTSARNGGYPIIWKPDGTGVKWCYVLLGSQLTGADTSVGGKGCGKLVGLSKRQCVEFLTAAGTGYGAWNAPFNGWLADDRITTDDGLTRIGIVRTGDGRKTLKLIGETHTWYGEEAGCVRGYRRYIYSPTPPQMEDDAGGSDEEEEADCPDDPAEVLVRCVPCDVVLNCGDDEITLPRSICVRFTDIEGVERTVRLTYRALPPSNSTTPGSGCQFRYCADEAVSVSPTTGTTYEGCSHWWAGTFVWKDTYSGAPANWLAGVQLYASDTPSGEELCFGLSVQYYQPFVGGGCDFYHVAQFNFDPDAPLPFAGEWNDIGEGEFTLSDDACLAEGEGDGTYDCVAGNCVEAEGGAYATLEDCEAACDEGGDTCDILGQTPTLVVPDGPNAGVYVANGPWTQPPGFCVTTTFTVGAATVNCYYCPTASNPAETVEIESPGGGSNYGTFECGPPAVFTFPGAGFGATGDITVTT